MLSFLDSLSARVSTLLFLVTVLDRIIPTSFRNTIGRYYDNLLNYFNPYVVITFDEHPPESSRSSKAYNAIQSYLGASFSLQAERLKGNMAGDDRSLELSIDAFEEVTDTYQGVTVSWEKTKVVPKTKVISKCGGNIERRAYELRFRRQDTESVVGSYLGHVFSEGEMIQERSRGQRMYTNDCEMSWIYDGFEHPATFDTLAMDPKKKKDIMDDLVQFAKGKEYYKKIGKPWKRGYLLYGPPGTGKSTMIAAMANFLHYDVYDLELTAVESNTALRELIIDIPKRAIVVIEDINCSLEITRKRRGKKRRSKTRDKDESDKEDEDKKKNKVTLSGLLNFMDGLWSASGGERIFVITTNYKEKLDKALVRTGRMDMHIEMSYCCYEAFKVLAKNYLDLECHDKFDKIEHLLSEIEMSPADVAENLMPKSAEMSADECLERLIAALIKSKEEGERKEVAKLESDSDIDSDSDTDMGMETVSSSDSLRDEDGDGDSSSDSITDEVEDGDGDSSSDSVTDKDGDGDENKSKN